MVDKQNGDPAMPVVAHVTTVDEAHVGGKFLAMEWLPIAESVVCRKDNLVRQSDALAAIAARDERISGLEADLRERDEHIAWMRKEHGQEVAALTARSRNAEDWITGRTLPPRYKNSCESVTVLAWAETGDGCLQLTPAKIPHLTKGEWREVRFDHDGMGRKIDVRCWTTMPSFPRSFVGVSKPGEVA